MEERNIIFGIADFLIGIFGSQKAGKEYRIGDAQFVRFDRAAVRGRIFSIAGTCTISQAIIREQRRLGVLGDESHCGIIGYEGFGWELLAHGLDYEWIGRYFQMKRGGILGLGRKQPVTRAVRIWDLKPECGARALTSEDYARAFMLIKEKFRQGVPYDFLELLTAGKLDHRAALVCSGLVKLFIDELIRPQGKRIAEQFFMPNHIRWYCDLVAEF